MRLILSLIFALLVGALMGGLLFGADSIGYYLILLMPLVAGGAVGFATYFPAVAGRIKTFPLLIVATLGCAAVVIVYWGGSYLSYQELAVTEFINSGATREQAIEFLPEFEQEVTGTTGFMAMVTLYAQEGLSISRFTGSSGLELKDGLAYAYWIGEIVLMLFVAYVSVFRRYTTRFGQKYAQPEPVPVLQAAPRTLSDDIIRRA